MCLLSVSENVEYLGPVDFFLSFDLICRYEQVNQLFFICIQIADGKHEKLPVSMIVTQVIILQSYWDIKPQEKKPFHVMNWQSLHSQLFIESEHKMSVLSRPPPHPTPTPLPPPPLVL